MKIRAFTGSAAVDSIESFVSRAYINRNPAVLGSLVVGYARSANDDGDLFTLVESLVTSNHTYVASTEGLKCLTLLAKAHTDIGQPRKSWMLWRQAMIVAQFIVCTSQEYYIAGFLIILTRI